MFMKGALVQFMDGFLAPMPNVILFQFNPESMTHSWTAVKTVEGANPMAASTYPEESFSFTIAVDAGDQIADGNALTAKLAEQSGVHARLAALEMLQYPVKGFTKIGKRQVPSMQVPTVLFVWGESRIVPVRITSLVITEKLYDAMLNPTHAEAQLGMKVLSKAELGCVSGPMQEIGQAAYDYSHGLRKTFAAKNLANASDSVLGLLP